MTKKEWLENHSIDTIKGLNGFRACLLGVSHSEKELTAFWRFWDEERIHSAKVYSGRNHRLFVNLPNGIGRQYLNDWVVAKNAFRTA